MTCFHEAHDSSADLAARAREMRVGTVCGNLFGGAAAGGVIASAPDTIGALIPHSCPIEVVER
eukprot:4742094-Pyramimonas_sp.AAC.1